jgi:hypothetical protein
MGVFAQIMTGLAAEAPDNKTISFDAAHLKTHRTASSLWAKRGGRGRLIGFLKKEHGYPVKDIPLSKQTSDGWGPLADDVRADFEAVARPRGCNCV